jgi:hypothetical protein
MTSLLTNEPVFEEHHPGSSRSRIRPLAEGDLGQISDLFQRVAGHPVQGSASLLKRIFFESPWHDGSVTSLIYEDESGRVVGSLGIMPRPMKFRGGAIRAAVGHHFMVEPSRQGMRAGIELMRHFIRGPQDLAITAGSEFSRRIWEFVGGSVSPLHSFSWTRSLRPAQYALALLKHRGIPAPAATALTAACHAVDATLNLFGRRGRVELPLALADDLDAVTMVACLSAFASDRALHPVYDVSSVSWLVDTLNESHHRGHLHKVAVRTYSGRPLGWYLYYLKRSGVAEVLQMGGREDTVREVLHHLFYHARERGAVAVTGPMDARLFGILSESRCVFHRPDNSWTLIHARDQRIADAIHSGDAFVSRLELAWWGIT